MPSGFLIDSRVLITVFEVPGRKGLTTSMLMQQRIRQLEGQGMSHARIARELHVSRTTVVKYASREDFSPRPAGRAGRTLIDSGYAEIVEGWLTADLRLPRKQRHTAMRVWQRLRDEHGFEGSYPSVQRWVKRWRERHRAESEGYARLAWAPGTAQVDFGQARASIAGVERVVHFLVVSYPYSNMRYVAALPGETSGCVCHGLGEVFARVGMAPRVVVFDNATGVGHRNADGTVTQTVMFQRFCAQYGFEARFCNPYSGNEKGSVENAVGFVRRNLMVPVPSAEGYQALTRAWFDACERLAQADHYRLGVPVAGLFESEKCISSSRCFVFSHVFFSGLGSCMHFPYFSGCAEVFLPNMRASLTRRLWPVNSRSRPWCTMRSMIAAASLSSAKTVPHLLNSMFVVNMMLRLS